MKKFNTFINEVRSKNAVVVFGRMNPPTKGHEEMIKYAVSMAKKYKADNLIYTSHTEDNIKNPLSYKDKIQFLKKIFPYASIIKSPYRTPFEILDNISSKYDKIYFVVGGDRFVEFSKRFAPYFPNVEVVISGGRKVGVSATDQRKAASRGDFEEFRKGLPASVSPKLAQEIFNKTEKGLANEKILKLHKRK